MNRTIRGGDSGEEVQGRAAIICSQCRAASYDYGPSSSDGLQLTPVLLVSLPLGFIA